MRVLITLAPLMYRQTLALVLRELRHVEVVLAAPESQDAEVGRRAPDLVICNEATGKVRSSGVAWIEVSYTGGLRARTNGGGGELVIENAGTDFLLDVLDRLRETVPEE